MMRIDRWQDEEERDKQHHDDDDEYNALRGIRARARKRAREKERASNLRIE